MAFIVDTYLAPLAAPNALVTSVRCVLRSGNRVMVMENAEGRRHVLPGGRIEPGESFFGALRREIREETEYALAGAELLGACVFTHTTPRPDNYQYPYPTMIHLIYRAEAGEADPGGMDHQGFEVSCEFVSRDELERIVLTAGERALVEASYADP
ncbi:MAG: NUDIX hydrolase [Gammaproteobacteria bacterium]|nr:NUDIX hydrolase [Gammaproteobacteria bacterium]